jgi:hypothetical protein
MYSMSGLVKSSLVGTRPRPTSSHAGCATAISYTKLHNTDKKKTCLLRKMQTPN